jgi:multiple sugar transport system permease protein
MKVSKNLPQVALWTVLLAGLAIFSIPYVFMISNSFETFSYVLPNPPRILPENPNLQAYAYILGQKNILDAFFNSVSITLVTTFFSLAVASLSAYGFARIRFFGREVLFKIYLLTLMIPGFLGIIPQFLILQGIKIPGLFPDGMIGTRAGLILLYVGTGVCGSTFFLKGFFESIPKEIEESVVIDGGTHRTVFSRIMLPLSKPALGTLAIFGMQGTWEEFFTAKIILGGSKQQMMTLPVIVQRLQGQHATRWEWVFAASILMQLPIILIFIIFQKKFVIGGLSEGSVKS